MMMELRIMMLEDNDIDADDDLKVRIIIKIFVLVFIHKEVEIIATITYIWKLSGFSCAEDCKLVRESEIKLHEALLPHWKQSILYNSMFLLRYGSLAWIQTNLYWCSPVLPNWDFYPFQIGLNTRNVLRRTFRVHPRPLSIWKLTGWSPLGEHSMNSGWTRREIRARPSSTNTERPPEDVPCLPQTAANMKALGAHTVCKPEPEIPE